MMIIAVDTGNRLMKTAHAPAFSAGLNYHGNTPPVVATDTLIYNGEYYSFSESQGYHRKDKTVDNYYYILTLAAIAREIVAKNTGASDEEFPMMLRQASRSRKEYKEEIYLSVGLPPRDMKTQAKKFKEYFLQGGKTVSFAYNGISFELTIQDIFVSPQGFAAIFPNDVFQQVSRAVQSYIIDIGGYTTDIALVVNKKIDTNFFESLDYGVIHMNNEISGQIAKECQKSITGVLIEAILRGESVGDAQVERVVKEAAAKYAKKIVDALRDHGIDLELSLPVLAGGGSLLLREPLLKALNRPEAIILDNIRANAIGYEVLARRALKEIARR